MSFSRLLLVVAAVFFLPSSFAEPSLELATEKGCFVCHSIQADAKVKVPLAPSYTAIANRYKDDSQAFTLLVDRVLHGTLYSGQNWEGEVSMRFMPPNVNVSRSEAGELTNWILNLPVDEKTRQALVQHEEMLIMTTRNGCNACHRMDPVADARLLPLAPSYREIAERYQGQSGAAAVLAGSIVNGTLGNEKKYPNSNMLFMPANVALPAADADRLARWILDL